MNKLFTPHLLDNYSCTYFAEADFHAQPKSSLYYDMLLSIKLPNSI